MTTIMTRSAIIFWGKNPNIDPDLAYVISDRRGRRVVTWTEINEERRKKQRQHLEDIRREPIMRPTRLWVGYNRHWIMQGWFAVLDNLHHRECAWGRTPHLMDQLMRLFPITFRLGSLREDFQMWCEAFSKSYPRGRYGGKQRGFTIVKWDGDENLRRSN